MNFIRPNDVLSVINNVFCELIDIKKVYMFYHLINMNKQKTETIEK